MPKFAANLTMLFGELEFMSRFEAAARYGFKAIEYLFPYPYEKDKLVEALHCNQLTQVLHNLPAGDWAAGDRGIACDPDRIGEFQDGIELALEYAKALGCQQLNCLVGKLPSGVSAEKAEQTVVANLKFAASHLAENDIKLLIEAVNNIDVPGFFLHSTGHALQIINKVNSQNLYLQYDIYHMQMMEGNLANTIAANLARIAHIQLADVPGRHEPGTGEINYRFLFDFLDRKGFEGWIGCEYVPLSKTEDGLVWMRA
jgi:hydroxypyruvate isomerase